MWLLEARELTKRFGGLVALDRVTFGVAPGEILGLIGPNGSGKTTLFNLLSGHLAPSSGQVLLEGQEVTRLPPHRRRHLGLARTFQIVQPFRHLSVLENVLVAARFGLGRHRAAAEALADAERVLDRVGLIHRRHTPAHMLSLGELKRLELARALAASPKIVLLDEVGAGLSPAAGAALRDLLRQLRDEGLTIVGIEHAPRAVADVSDRMIVLYKGRILAEGQPEEVIQNPQVVSAYMGEE